MTRNWWTIRNGHSGSVSRSISLRCKRVPHAHRTRFTHGYRDTGSGILHLRTTLPHLFDADPPREMFPPSVYSNQVSLRLPAPLPLKVSPGVVWRTQRTLFLTTRYTVLALCQISSLSLYSLTFALARHGMHGKSPRSPISGLPLSRHAYPTSTSSFPFLQRSIPTSTPLYTSSPSLLRPRRPLRPRKNRRDERGRIRPALDHRGRSRSGSSSKSAVCPVWAYRERCVSDLTSLRGYRVDPLRLGATDPSNPIVRSLHHGRPRRCTPFHPSRA